MCVSFQEYWNKKQYDVPKDKNTTVICRQPLCGGRYVLDSDYLFTESLFKATCNKCNDKVFL